MLANREVVARLVELEKKAGMLKSLAEGFFYPEKVTLSGIRARKVYLEEVKKVTKGLADVLDRLEEAYTWDLEKRLEEKVAEQGGIYRDYNNEEGD